MLRQQIANTDHWALITLIVDETFFIIHCGEQIMETKTGNVGKTSSIKLRDDGVYLVNGSGYRERIADPISVTALGVGLQDDVSYTVLKFGDRDGKLKTDVVRSALLTAAPRDFTARMTDAGYIWPETSAHCGRLIRVLSAQNPNPSIFASSLANGCATLAVNSSAMSKSSSAFATNLTFASMTVSSFETGILLLAAQKAK
jgi:hypothetical protein